MREKKETPRYLTTTQAARRAHVSPSTLLRAVQSKKLKAFSTPGGHFRIDPVSLQVFLQASGAVPEKKKVVVLKVSPEETEKLLGRLKADESFSVLAEAQAADKPALILLDTTAGKNSAKPRKDLHALLRRWCGLN
jgi:excisionase family DNA binding protein